MVNERTRKIIKLDIRKKSDEVNDTASLDVRITRFRKRIRQPARRLGTQDNLAKSSLSHLLNNDPNEVYELFKS